jgi:hypothetical protein
LKVYQMVSRDRDIDVAAVLLIARYGNSAPLRAHRAANLAKVRDFGAHRVWIEVIRAIDQLQEQKTRASTLGLQRTGLCCRMA